MASFASDACWEQDIQLRFTAIGGHIARIAGLMPGDFVGFRRWELDTEGVTEDGWAAHRSALDARQPFSDFEYAARGSDGRLTWFSVSGEPWFTPTGEFGGYRGIAFDITRMRVRENELRESEKLLRMLADAVPGVLSCVDRNERITYVNRASESIYGLPAADVVGKTIGEISRPAVYEFVRPHIRRALGGEPAEYQRSHRRPDGTIREIQATLIPQRSCDGEVTGYFGLFTDITNLGKVRRTLAGSQARIFQRQELLSRLTASDDIFGENTDLAFARIIEAAIEELEVDRVSLWLFDPPREALVCADQFERVTRTHSKGRELRAKDYPRYFQAVASNTAIDATDANADPRTSEFSDGYLRPNGIGAMLDAPVRRHQVTSGVLRCEHVGGPRAWSPEDNLFAVALANLASLALEVGERRRAEAALRASEERFQDFARASGDWFWESDTEGRLVWISESVRHTTGMPAAWFLGKDVRDLLLNPKDLEGDAYTYRKKAGSLREPYRDAKFLVRLPSGERWISNSGLPRFDSNGAYAGYRGTTTDISARVATEAAAGKAETLLKDAIDALSTPISLTDSDDRIVVVNQAFVTQYPESWESAIGKHYAQYLRDSIAPTHAADATGREEEWVQARMARRGQGGVGHEQLRKDGTWHLVTDQRLPGGGTITFNLDITQAKLREAELERQALLFGMVIGAMGEGVSVFDADLRLVAWNGRFVDHCGGIDTSALRKGTTLREILVGQARAGEFGICDPEAEADRRLAEKWPDHAVAHERTKPDGRTIEIRRYPIPEGGFVTVYLDVTSRKRSAQELEALNADLEARVAERTASLSASERQLRIVAEHIPAIVVHFDRDLVCRYANSHYAKILGRTPEEMIGMRFGDLVSTQRAAEEHARIQRALSGETVSFERTTHDGKGTTDTTLVPYVEPDGTPNGYFAFAVDVTARKRQEVALRDSEARLRQVIDLVPHFVFAKDSQGRYLFSNVAYARAYGLAPDQVVGKTSAGIGMLPDEVALVDSVDAEIRRSGRRVEIPAQRTVGLDGIIRIFRNVRLPIRYSSEAPDAVLVVATDITELKAAQSEVEKLNIELEARVAARTVELEAANLEMESFSYSISHDLRGPVRAVSGFSALLEQQYRQELPPDAQKLLDRILAAGVRMGTMIDGLLELARLSRSAVRRQSVDLAAIAQEVWGESTSGESGREVAFSCPIPIFAVCDPVLSRIALQNLLGNAFKYTRGKTSGQVEFGEVSDASPRTFYVRDNGAGFDMTYSDRLFGTFQRLHSEKEFEGTGIGLATVRRIVERHGGRIWANAMPDSGATFWFTLGETGEAGEAD